MLSLNIRRALGVAAAVIVAASFSVAAHAQDKMDKMEKSDKMGKMNKMDKMDKMDKSVYVCKQCKMYYSAADSKKMGMKDPMGHKLTKMSKAPAGYKMGGKMDKMGGHMDKMDKMGHDKMDKMAPKP